MTLKWRMNLNKSSSRSLIAQNSLRPLGYEVVLQNVRIWFFLIKALNNITKN